MKVDEKTNRPAGSAEIVQALCDVLIAEPLSTFQLDYEQVFDQDVGELFTDIVALVFDR